MEIEAADDFTLSTDFDITSAIFTGLMPTAMPLNSVQGVSVEIYHIFPTDSANPPDGRVPTRVSSPADAEFDYRDSGSTTFPLTFVASTVTATFGVDNTVVNGINPEPGQFTGGDGPASGEEVQFGVAFTTALSLPAGHYFFVPKVQLSSGDFLWLSAPGPPVPPPCPTLPEPPICPRVGDFQAWIRNAILDPDWLRVGTDIVGGSTPPKFNGSFSLSGSAPTPTPSPTPSPSPTLSPSPTPSPTRSPTPTPSPTRSPTATPHATPTPTATVGPSHTPTATPGSTIRGDANCDGKVTVDDVLDTLSDTAGVDPGARCPENANVDCDAGVTAFDALRILDYVAQAPLPQGTECPPIGT